MDEKIENNPDIEDEKLEEVVGGVGLEANSSFFEEDDDDDASFFASPGVESNVFR